MVASEYATPCDDPLDLGRFFYFTFLQTLLKGNNEKNNKVSPLRNSLHLKINFNSDDVLCHNPRNH